MGKRDELPTGADPSWLHQGRHASTGLALTTTQGLTAPWVIMMAMLVMSIWARVRCICVYPLCLHATSDRRRGPKRRADEQRVLLRDR
jgi:hypothetical protein